MLSRCKKPLTGILSLVLLLTSLSGCAGDTKPADPPVTIESHSSTSDTKNETKIESSTETESATETKPATEVVTETEPETEAPDGPVDLGAILGRKDLRYDYNKAVEDENLAESPVKYEGSIDYLDMVGLGQSITCYPTRSGKPG